MSTTDAQTLKTKIRNVPDFPKAGILFYDITTLLQDPAGLRAAIDGLSSPFKNDAHRRRRRRGEPRIHFRRRRGGPARAPAFRRSGRQGKLPWKTRRATYDLEYGTDSLEIHDDGVGKGSAC